MESQLSQLNGQVRKMLLAGAVQQIDRELRIFGNLEHSILADLRELCMANDTQVALFVQSLTHQACLHARITPSSWLSAGREARTPAC